MGMKRAPLMGRIWNILIIILLLLTTSICIYTKRQCDELSVIIAEQESTITKLETEKAALNDSIQQLEEKNKQLEDKNKQLENKIKKQQSQKKVQATIEPKTNVVIEPTSGNSKNLGTFKISAYCHCTKCCGKSDGVTATGTRVAANRTIAVDPKVIPLGSKVIIDGHTYVAEDTGGAIKGNRIDMYFSTHKEALNWGVRTKNVSLVS